MIKSFIKFAGYVISFGLAINLFYIFLRAYYSPIRYYTLIHINNYGEAQVELILFSITIIFCLVGLLFAWRDLKKQK